MGRTGLEKLDRCISDEIAERDQEDRIVSAMQGEHDGQLIIGIEAIKFRAVEQNAAVLANAWIKFER